MNIENAQKLLGQLERLPDEQFDMSDYIVHTSCGTICCVAGWASVLNGGPTSDVEGDEAYDFAARWLDLELGEADRLFFATQARGLKDRWADVATGDGRFLDEVTRAEMISELRLMIEEAKNAQA